MIGDEVSKQTTDRRNARWTICEMWLGYKAYFVNKHGCIVLKKSPTRGILVYDDDDGFDVHSDEDGNNDTFVVVGEGGG